MTGGLDALFAATILFVGGHFILSSAAVRPGLVARLGERGFLGTYSIVVLVAFAWMIVAYRGAPFVELWAPIPALRWIPTLVLPFAFILAVTGVATSSATAVAGAHGAEPPPATGIMRVTRHPALWGITLWAACHILVNGDAAGVILFGGIMVLSLGGMWHIDRRRERQYGSGWGPIALTTSVIPFAAIASGRAQMDWAGIGWWRPALGIVVFVGLQHAHSWIFGVSALPL